ncbi:MAG: glycosyltransferase family 39 protein [Candidatus Cybelea sp.]
MRTRVAAIAALVTLGLHLAANPHYGFFRDELYFIICGFHPAWGYVDQPPVVPLLSAGSQLFGHSLFALRAIPAIFAAAGAYVTCLLAFELGGATFAAVLAVLAYLAAGVLESFGAKAGPDMAGLWLWPLCALYVLRIVKGADPRWWLAAGAVVGIAIESKYSVLFFAVALLAGLALTPQRRVLGSGWFYAGAGVAAIIAFPNFLWQALHGFPMWELLRNGANGKNLVAGPLLFLFQQLLLTNLFASPIWIAGLIWLLRNTTTRFLGYAYLIVIAMMIALHAKHYYPANVYPILMAGGGVAIESWIGATLVRGAIVTATVAAWLFFAPFSLPILSEPAMLDYTRFVGSALHIQRAALATEKMRKSALPEDWADMHGWPELAATVARIYYSLPAQQRDQTAIVASNYGEAAAIDFFGTRYGLPPALSGHNNYWLWGTHGYSGNVVIDVNGDCGASRHLFRTARVAARFNPPWVISYEQNIPIMVCTGIRTPISELWPKLRFYI